MAPRQFTATVLVGLRHRQTIRSLHSKAQGTLSTTDHESQQTHNNDPLLHSTEFSPLPLPWQAEPKKLQHEKRQRKGKRERKEKKRKETVLHIASHKLTFNRLFSPQTDRMETRNISRTRKCFPEDGEENHLFSIYVIYIETSHILIHSKGYWGKQDSEDTNIRKHTVINKCSTAKNTPPPFRCQTRPF